MTIVSEKSIYNEVASQESFEDPEVGIKHPGKKLAETSAALFSKPHSDPDKDKPELDDDSFPKKLWQLVVPPPP